MEGLTLDSACSCQCLGERGHVEVVVSEPRSIDAVSLNKAVPPGGPRNLIRVSVISSFIESRQTTSQFAYMSTVKIYIVYYSLYGHVETMARAVQRGANSVDGVEATLWQVPETLSEVILQKMKAPPKAGDISEIRPEQLAEADGFIFGFPSRFGVMAAQCKAFFEATHGLWETQALAGKPAGIFWSTGFPGGGQELTALTAVTQLAHHGMLFVPLGYTYGEGMFELNEMKGGSSYGAGTYAADGSRRPTELELGQAFHQGKYVAEITRKLKRPVASCSFPDN